MISYFFDTNDSVWAFTEISKKPFIAHFSHYDENGIPYIFKKGKTSYTATKKQIIACINIFPLNGTDKKVIETEKINKKNNAYICSEVIKEQNKFFIDNSMNKFQEEENQKKGKEK